MQEEWRDIKGFEGLYRISNTGKVLSLNYANRGYSKELTPKKNNNGYLWVQLKNGKIQKNMQIHRLVAMAFIENPNGYPVINHLDENPLNNHVDNLEWCTHRYNCIYSLNRHRAERVEALRGHRQGNCGHRNGKPRAAIVPLKDFDKVIQRNIEDNSIVAIHDNIATIVRKLGYNNTSIKECCLGKRKTAYGYKWEFEKPILNTPERTGSSNANSERTEDKKCKPTRRAEKHGKKQRKEEST